MKSNEDWMIEFQAGNVEALSILYERLYEPLYCFLFRYTREEQISVDTVHDTFEVLQKKKHNYDIGKGTIKTFLFQIAYRILLNKLNRRKRWQSVLPFLLPTYKKEFPLEDSFLIQQAIENLPDKQKAVILLAYYEDLTQEEIAAVLTIPPGTVKSRLHNAIKALKQDLKEDFEHER